MRLPNLYTDKEKTHYLTDFYIKEFHLKTGPFNNYDKNAWLKFYDKDNIRISGIYIYVFKRIVIKHTKLNKLNYVCM